IVRNFGAIFDTSTNMKKLASIFLIFLAVGITVNGQENAITEFDLYGCWILERSEDGQRPQKRIYKHCESSDSKLSIKGSKISFLAFNVSEIERSHPFLCGTNYIEEGTWEYDETNGLITMYSNKEFLKELKEKYPEEYVKFGSPERVVSNKFRVLQLSETQMEVEKLRTIE
ncbi:unnamed protein product, partial [Ectocarpus sp. 12 AP-2014]